MVKDYRVMPEPEGWQRVIDEQNAAYPRCAAHGVPTAFIVGDRPVCMKCVEEDPTIRLWLKSGSLVSGGLV